MLKRIPPQPDAGARIEYLRADVEAAFRRALRESNPSTDCLKELADFMHSYMESALRESGYEHSKAAVAAILGENAHNYRTALRGRRVSLDRLCRWYTVWSLTWSSLHLPDAMMVDSPSRVHGRETSVERKEREEKERVAETLSRYGARPAGTKP